MKTVCFLLTSLESGGAENYLLRFIKHSEGEFRAVVICKSGKKGVLENDYISANAIIEIIPAGYFNVGSWIKAYKVFKKYKVSAICDFTGNFAGVFLVLAKLAGVSKRISFYRRSSHAFRPTLVNNLYDKWVNGLVAKHATNILANSMHGLNFFHPKRDLNDKRFGVIFNGLNETEFVSNISKKDIREELGIPQDAFFVGHTGRLNVAKNHPTMLKIAEQLVDKHDEMYFLFCGKETEKLMQQTSSEKLKKRLILLGYRTDVNRILKAMDLYIFPSITEGQPNALIEAMITGLPCLYSDIETIKEVVPISNLHAMFPPYDVQSFVDTIEKAYQNTEFLKSFVSKSHAVSQFNSVTNFNKFNQLL
jgi:glycosyltransferase involved in cell wall biosynthesis